MGNAIVKPLVTHIYAADPAAHVFNDRVYIYPSHDIDAGIPENDNGDHFDMRDYHVLSLDSIDGEVTDHGCTSITADTTTPIQQAIPIFSAMPLVKIHMGLLFTKGKYLPL